MSAHVGVRRAWFLTPQFRRARCSGSQPREESARSDAPTGQKVLDKVSRTGDERFGVDIIRRAIELPLRTIAQNAGIDGAIVVE